MKTNLIVTLLALSFANVAWAQGGLSIENVQEHMNAEYWTDTQSVQPEITAKGNIEKFIVDAPQAELSENKTDKFMQSYDGQV